MIIGLIYLLSVVLVFIGIILHERKTEYLDQEALFFIILASVLWPFALGCLAVIEFFRWLEKVVNK